MDKYKKLAMIMCSIGLMFLLTGITYAYFNYTKTGDNNSLVTGDIYMHLNEGVDNITLTNVFPETKEEARARNDNEITFTISGINTSSKTIYYEIDLMHGSNVSGKTRFRDSELKFDLIEVGANDEETYLVDAGNYSDLTNKRIWVETVNANTTTEIERTYKLRMWLSEDVIISDSDPNASYPATGNNAFKNHFASIRVKVLGDFQEKILSAYYMLKNNADTTTVIDFSQTVSESNGQGLYRLFGTENDDYPIYYYRGDVDNNNVLFAGFCWQMVRTTETGGIKMIYNGLPDISGSGNNITYNCGPTRKIQERILSDLPIAYSTGFYFADDYEIVSITGVIPTYRLKSKNNPITQVPMTNENIEATIPTIVANYPYTCTRTTPDGTCNNIYKIVSYKDYGMAYVYNYKSISFIGYSKFNLNINSMSDVGYMSNIRYEKSNDATSGVIYGKNIEWNGSSYLVIENTPGVAATGKTRNDTHHYTCGVVGVTRCNQVKYYFYMNYGDYYITLSNGELLDDAIYKMTGNGSQEVKLRNDGYVLNQNDSVIKGVIDTWFRENLTNEVNTNNTNYSAYIEDTIYCNDRSFKTIEGNTSYSTYNASGWNPNGGSLTRPLYFGTLNRKYNNWYSTSNVPAVKNTGEIPNIACPNETDRFTVSNILGNGELTYPVGLLTVDEFDLAGNTSPSYLYNDVYWWTLSPSLMNDEGISVSGNNSTNSAGVRPVISLKLGVEFEESGDGTPTNPYIVKYN